MLGRWLGLRYVALQKMKTPSISESSMPLCFAWEMHDLVGSQFFAVLIVLDSVICSYGYIGFSHYYGHQEKPFSLENIKRRDLHEYISICSWHACIVVNFKGVFVAP